MSVANQTLFSNLEIPPRKGNANQMFGDDFPAARIGLALEIEMDAVAFRLVEKMFGDVRGDRSRAFLRESFLRSSTSDNAAIDFNRVLARCDRTLGRSLRVENEDEVAHQSFRAVFVSDKSDLVPDHGNAGSARMHRNIPMAGWRAETGEKIPRPAEFE